MSTTKNYLDVSTPNLVLATLAAVLSLFGTTFIVVTFFIWKEIRSTSRRILVYISIADFFVAVGTVVGVSFSKHSTTCLIQSICGTYFVLCSFFWTVFLAVYLFIGCTNKRILLAERLVCLFHVIAWGVPLTIVCIAVAKKKLGDNGDIVSSGWCWVSANMSWKEQVKWMLIAGKFWEVTAFVIITILFIFIRQGMRKVLNNEEGLLLSERSSRAAQTAERKLILVPLSFILLRIWGTVRFFIFVVTGPNKVPPANNWLLVLQGIGDTLPGFANFLIFCFFTEKVQGHLRTAFGRCFSRCCPGVLAGYGTRLNHDRLRGVCVPTSSNPDLQTFGK
ncbi:G-protein coupled receptor 157-like [Actinia tenebrosa]|uniref:G-protein coupled receptor 157-like n=1 Tax=Actinia tenebrosa TaxID=6105 RepID=A0A6P8ILI2_ACTTE|nr:G-protein coupled receptor 157-like [Actinia tenebrosa]